MTSDCNSEVVRLLEVIDNQILAGDGEAALESFNSILNDIENEERPIREEIKAKFYVEYAYFLFQLAEFGLFFEMMKCAQKYGHSGEEVTSLVYEAFVEPNRNDFRNIYDENIHFLIEKGYLLPKDAIAFDQLPYWLLTTGSENEYYLFDKEKKVICDPIQLFQSRDTKTPLLAGDFSDYLIVEEWDWYTILSYMNSVLSTEKKVYIVLDEIGKFLSCLQGAKLQSHTLSNVLLLNKLSGFEDYFKNNAGYIPMNVFNYSDSESLNESIRNIHAYRISDTRRERNNVLLSICIPSYNRGERAYHNVKHLLQSHYNDEIEIVLSNNGTKNGTEQYYERIGDIEDARLKYYAFEENEGFAINCCKVCELASGAFILLVSDEDLVNFNALDIVMNILDRSKETLSLVRTASSTSSKPATKVASSGEDAMLTYMLTSNYMSGMILNNRMLKQCNGLGYVKENLNNSVCYYYPHMYWELLLCQYGIVQGMDLVLIDEGEAEKTEVVEVELEGSERLMPYYATIEGRLEQHEGFLRIFKDLEVCRLDHNLYRKMYLHLCAKTLHLVALSIKLHYSKTEQDTEELMRRAFHFCMEEKFYRAHISDTMEHYQDDRKVIAQLYNRLYN